MKYHLYFAMLLLVASVVVAGSIEIPQFAGSYYYVESATGEEAITYDVDIQGLDICLVSKPVTFDKKVCLDYPCKKYRIDEDVPFIPPASIKLNKNQDFDGVVINDGIGRFCYKADPKLDKWLKFGENSIVIVSSASTNFWSGAGLFFMPQKVSGNYVGVSINENRADDFHCQVGYWNQTYSHDTADGLVLNLPLDSDADDYSGSGNDGVVSGATATTSGKYGGAYDFYNTSINITLTPSLNTSYRSFSFSAWVYSNPRVSSDDPYIIFNFQTSVGGWYSQLANMNPGFSIFNGTTTYSVISPADLPTGWVHLLGTYTLNENMSFYVNGDLVGSTAVGGGATYSTKPITIGHAYSNRIPSVVWNGSIDEFKIWNRSLTADEVKQEYIKGTMNWSYSPIVDCNQSAYIAKGATDLMPVVNANGEIKAWPYLEGSIYLSYEDRRPLCDIGQNSTELDCECPTGSNMNTASGICQEIIAGASSGPSDPAAAAAESQGMFSEIGKFVNGNIGLVAIIMILIVVMSSRKHKRR